MDLWRSINKNSNAHLNGIRWALPKITKLPLINGFTSRAALIPLISSLCSVLKLWSSTPLISSLLCPLRVATSLSVVSHPWIFFLFFFFLRLLQRALICIFYIFLFMSNLIWEINFEGRDLINKTPSNTNLLPKTTKYQHWSEFFFFTYQKKKISDLACFVLAKDLFVLLPGTEIFFSYMLCNFFFFCGCTVWLLGTKEICKN